MTENQIEIEGHLKNVNFILDQDEDSKSNSDNSSESSSAPSYFDEELEIPVSISGIHAKTLTDMESMQLSSSLRVANKNTNPYLKELFYAGVAPSRFNLAKVSAGKYVTRFFRHHNWSTQRSKYLWQRVRIHVLGDKAPEYDEEEEDEDGSHQSKLTQGFKLQTVFKRPNEISALVHNPKLPPHLLDGSLGYDFNEGEAVNFPIANYDDNEDEEDFFSESAGGKKYTSHTFVIIDTKKMLTMYESQSSHPTGSLKLDQDMTFVIFIPKYCLYAGLVEQKTIKFFTSKLDFTSITKSPFPILSLLYETRSNELIGVGTHKIIVWSLESSYIKGAVSLTSTVKIILEPQNNSNQWISLCCIVERMRKLWVVVDKNIYVYDMETGECVHFIKQVMARRITCIASHDSNSYMLVGSIDGTVKVLNIINATVHEFFAHSRPVVSVAVIPNGPLFLTIGQDNTLRLFNLKYFREICCIHLKERPIEMGMMDESSLYIRTRSCTEVWATNQFNINYATMSSSITHLQYVKSDGIKLSKVFARTCDNVARLLSPITGRTITANLPPVENEVVLDIAYYLQIDRMYVLLEKGDIWVFRTDQNPCTIVDVWNSTEARNENCSHLIICQGEFDEADAKHCPPQLKTFGFLLAGTKNGHIILIGRGGSVIDRYQLHMGEISELYYQENGHVLISAGLDTRIRVSIIKPFHPNLIQIQIDIITNYIPQAISILGNIICVAADDASIQMFETNIKKQEWKIMKGHLKGHDHTERVTGITTCQETRVFLSIANDNTLRIWSDRNKFLREIHFQEQLSSLCLANEKGDVLLGVGNRIDIIKSSVYLPSSYLRNKKTHKKPPSEKPLLFDDSLVPFTRAPKISHRDREKLLVDKSSPFEIFCETNLRWFERASNIRRKPVYNMGADYVFGNEGAEMDNFINTIEEKMRKRKLILRNQRRKSMGYDGSKETEILRKKAALVLKTEDHLIDEEEEEKEVFVYDNETNLTPAEIMDKRLTNARLFFFSKDGALPNSKGTPLKLANGWKKIRTGVNISSGLKRRTSKDKSNSKGELSKSKLHAKMKMMLAQEKIDEERNDNLASTRSSSLVLGTKHSSQEIPQKLRIGQASKLSASDLEWSKAEHNLKDGNDIIIPLSLERIMNYDWFPEDALFHPINYQDPQYEDTVVLNSKGRRLDRIPKTKGNPDDLLPVLIETFNNANSIIRIEILNYIKWLESDCGFKEKKEDLALFFCEKVAASKVLGSEDVRNRIQMMEMAAGIPKAGKDLFITLLQQVKSPYNLLRYKSLQLIRSMGLSCIEEPFIQKMLDTIPEKLDQAKMQFDVSYGDEVIKRDLSIGGMTVELLQKSLQRYLLTTSQSIETTKILQNKDIWGQDDKARIEAQVVRKVKDRKGKKAIPLAASKSEENVDIFERRLSLVDQSLFEANSKKIRDAIARMRNRDLKTELDQKEYPKLAHVYAEPPPPESNRTPLKTLQDPQLSDYIDALNFIFYEEEERIAELERRKAAELQAEKKAHELLLIEQQRRADEVNAQQKIFEERIAAENARKERIRLLRLARKTGTEARVVVVEEIHEEEKKIRFSDMQTLGIGRTHFSHCHTSRETIDVRFKAKPKVLDSTEGYINSSLTMHFKTQNKSMLLEKVQLDPFAFENSQINQRPKTMNQLAEITGKKSPPLAQKRPKTALPNTTHEMEFIRGGQMLDDIPSSQQRPQTSRFRVYVEGNRQNNQSDLSQASFQPSKRYILPGLI